MHALDTRLKNLKLRGVGVVWMTPPSIQDERLVGEEKQTLMTEESVETWRESQRTILDSSDEFDLFLETEKITLGVAGESLDGVHYPERVYDVLVQIIAQSFDWALPDRELLELAAFKPNQPGKMANAGLGFAMLMLCAVGLFTFDGYMGFAWLGSLVTGGPDPRGMWEEAFEVLHKKIGVPVVERERKEGGGGGLERTWRRASRWRRMLGGWGRRRRMSCWGGGQGKDRKRTDRVVCLIMKRTEQGRGEGGGLGNISRQGLPSEST